MISQQGKGQTLCDVFDADGISGNTDATADYNGVDEFDFACAENEFLQGELVELTVVLRSTCRH